MHALSPVRLGRLVVVAVAAFGLASCGINSVPTAEEHAKAKWADVEAAFQERANLLQNLPAVVKAAGDREQEILTQVVDARARATSVTVSADDLDDPVAMKAFAEAQGQLSAGLGRLLANFEAYPELQSIENYSMLQEQVEGQENRIRIAIRDYNEAVRQYNTTIRTFPDMVAARVVYGADPMVPYTAVTENAEVAPSLEGKL